MAKDIVIMMDPAEQEALRNCGVLPHGMFRSFDDLANGIVKSGQSIVFEWPHLPDYSLPVAGRMLSLPELMGLPNAGDEEYISETYVARLFGKLLVHVAFLDQADGTSSGGVRFTGRRTSFNSIDSVIEWSDRLDEAVRARLYEEQARQLNHVLVLVARGGQVSVTQDEIDCLRRKFSVDGNMRTCYFLDYNLEVEEGDHLLHSVHVWPIMVGRLLLRFLLDGSTGSAQDGFLAPGFHLWRAVEFNFEYPKTELDELLAGKFAAIYREISKVSAVNSQTDSDLSQENETMRTGFGERLDISPPHAPEAMSRDWVDFPADTYAQRMSDDGRWAEKFSDYRAEFRRIESRRDLLGGDGGGGAFAGAQSCVKVRSPDDGLRVSQATLVSRATFVAVHRHPRFIFAAANEIEKEMANLKRRNSEDAFAKWQQLVAKENERIEHKKLLVDTASEFAKAQDHYLLKWVGMLAAGAVSLFCGITVQRLVWSLGVDFLTSIILGACPAVGAFAAWLILSGFHDRAGRKGLAALRDVGKEVDEKMIEKCDSAFEVVDAAETERKFVERWNLLSTLYNLLARIRRIVDREIQSPTAVVFFHEEAKSSKKQGTGDEFAESQVREFLGKTRISEKVTEVSVRDLQTPRTQAAIDDYFSDNGDRKFVTSWNRWCVENDRACQGNYPASQFVAYLRDFMQEVCDRISESLVDDILTHRDRAGGNALSVSLPSSLACLRSDSDYTYSSAHVDEEQVQASQSILFISNRYYEAANKELSDGGGETGFSVRASDLFARLPQYAFYYQDIQVCPERDENGRLGFSVKEYGK